MTYFSVTVPADGDIKSTDDTKHLPKSEHGHWDGNWTFLRPAN